eukprot:gene11596-22205_t
MTILLFWCTTFLLGTSVVLTSLPPSPAILLGSNKLPQTAPSPCMDLAMQYCNNASLNSCPHVDETWWPAQSGAQYAKLPGTPALLAPAAVFTFQYHGPTALHDEKADVASEEAASSPSSPPAVLAAAFARYKAILLGKQAAAVRGGIPTAAARFGRGNNRNGSNGNNVPAMLSVLDVHVDSRDTALDANTNESYTLNIYSSSSSSSPNSNAATSRLGRSHAVVAEVKAASVYGAMRALESFVQLASAVASPEPGASSAGANQGNGAVNGARDGAADATSNNVLTVPLVKIVDYPSYAWRGFMVDTGRRFWPVPLLQWLMDAMVLNKMNVLHLHFSDFCRFAVESKLYPELTANLTTGLQAGFYTQADVAAIVAYAAGRGIRVVPEVDLPGHARGLLPLEATWGLQFCDPGAADRSQVYDDPGNKTFAVLSKLLTEIASLFPDKVMHVGSDETHTVGLCSLSNTAGLERKVLKLMNKLGKRPMAWVNALTTTGAVDAANDTILGTWATVYGMPELVTSRGYGCVASTYMYLNHIDGDAGSYTQYWRDIAPDVSTPAEKKNMLGGEVSMWTDDYCYKYQCGSAPSGPIPTAAAFYGPAADKQFAASIAGVLFPRTSVGAGSLWSFDSSVSSTGRPFLEGMSAQNARMLERGLDSCPNNCTCDLLTRCGKPYA